MSLATRLKVKLGKIPCLSNISEDELRELVDAMVVEIEAGVLDNFVTSTGGINVKFNFSPDGNFAGITAKIDGKSVSLLGGAGGGELHTFAGPPSENNPGPGWTVERDLTISQLSQPQNEADWDIFYARRVSVLNTTN